MNKAYAMKNAGMFVAFIFALSSGAYGTEAAQGTEAGQIIMRLSEQNGLFLRFVFQSANEAMINSSTVAESYSLVKIDFPDSFSFQGTPLPEPLRITKRDNSLYLNIKNLGKIRVSRLSGPPRLVIDAYITGSDAAKAPAQSPVSTPAAQTGEAAGLRGLSILLDAGHGGIDTGITSGQLKESALSLSVCADIAKRIGNRARKVAITRKDDSALSIDQRLMDIRKYRPNLFISIHVSASGAFAIYTSSLPTVMSDPGIAYDAAYAQAAYIEKSRALSKAIGGAINEKLKPQAIYREMPLPVLSGTAAPAVLIELPNPVSFTYNNDSINSISDAIIKAVSEYAKK